MSKSIERFSRERAYRVARRVTDALDPQIARVAWTGSYRRGLETVGDVDILALARPGGDPLGAARRVADAVEREGDTIFAGVLEGVPFQVFLTTAETWGSSMQFTTGSHKHNVGVRAWARDLGLLASEFGVFTRRGLGPRVPGSSETEGGFYRALGLCWIPPERRIPTGHRGVVPLPGRTA